MYRCILSTVQPHFWVMKVCALTFHHPHYCWFGVNLYVHETGAWSIHAQQTSPQQVHACTSASICTYDMLTTSHCTIWRVSNSRFAHMWECLRHSVCHTLRNLICLCLNPPDYGPARVLKCRKPHEQRSAWPLLKTGSDTHRKVLRGIRSAMCHP